MALRFWPWQKLLRPGPILVNAPGMALSFALRLPSQFATNAITRCLKTYMHTGASVLSATPLHDYVPRKADKGECMQKVTKESSTGTHRSARALLIAPLTSQSSSVSVIHNEVFQAKALKGHHFYPSSPPASQHAKETTPSLVRLPRTAGLWWTLVGERHRRVALLHNTLCPRPPNRRRFQVSGWPLVG